MFSLPLHFEPKPQTNLPYACLCMHMHAYVSMHAIAYVKPNPNPKQPKTAGKVVVAAVSAAKA